MPRIRATNSRVSDGYSHNPFVTGADVLGEVVHRYAGRGIPCDYRQAPEYTVLSRYVVSSRIRAASAERD